MRSRVVPARASVQLIVPIRAIGACLWARLRRRLQRRAEAVAARRPRAGWRPSSTTGVPPTKTSRTRLEFPENIATASGAGAASPSKSRSSPSSTTRSARRPGGDARRSGWPSACAPPARRRVHRLAATSGATSLGRSRCARAARSRWLYSSARSSSNGLTRHVAVAADAPAARAPRTTARTSKMPSPRLASVIGHRPDRGAGRRACARASRSAVECVAWMKHQRASTGTRSQIQAMRRDAVRLDALAHLAHLLGDVHVDRHRARRCRPSPSTSSVSVQRVDRARRVRRDAEAQQRRRAGGTATSSRSSVDDGRGVAARSASARR